MIEVRKYRGHGQPGSSSVYIRTPVSTFEIYRSDPHLEGSGYAVYGAPVRCEWANLEATFGLGAGNERWVPYNGEPRRSFIERIHAQGLARLYAGIE